MIDTITAKTGTSSEELPSNLEEILEGFREILPRDALVDHKHRLIGKRVEILLRRHHLTAEEKVEAGGVEIAALERLRPKMVPERVQEGGIDAMLLGVVARPSGYHLDRCYPFGVGAADGELDARARHAGGKSLVLGHFGQVRHLLSFQNISNKSGFAFTSGNAPTQIVRALLAL